VSSAPYQTIPVTCPNCRYRFVAPVMTIIDAGQRPEAKALFLSGQLNVAVCPQCGHAGMLNTPLVYHDPDKELLLTYVPPELNLPEIEQQRIVGDLTNRVISALPAEKRRGYLLRPKSYLRLEAMIKDVLEADGVTQEMLEAQRARADLLDRLLRAEGEEARQAIAQANDAQIDYEFLDLLTLNAELAQRGQQATLVSELEALRAQLLRWTTLGQELAAREEAIASLGLTPEGKLREITRDELLDKLIEAATQGGEHEAAKVETMISIARPAIDYLFYQQLTERITAAEQAGDRDRAKILTALRQTILDETARLDEEARQAAEEAMQFLEQAVKSDDPQAFIRANAHQVDGLFMSILSANLRAAEQAGQTEALEQLRKVSDAVTAMVLESQPPEIQFINQLLSAGYPDGTLALLQENRQKIDDRLLEVMRLVAEDLGKNGREDAAQQLTQVRDQARGLAGS
jgi:CpXC protein